MRTNLFQATAIGALLAACTLAPMATAQVAQPAAAAAAQQPAQGINANAVAAQYAALVHANYEDTLAAARTMQAAVQAFTAKPSVETLAEARKQWLAAR